MAFPTSTTRLAYNGYSFNSTTKTRVQCRFLRDGANRTVIATVHEITAVTFIAESATATTMADLKVRLSKAGAALSYQNNGFGDLSIGGAEVVDVMWGPTPQVLLCEPMADNAWRLEWRVEVAIPLCDDAKYKREVMAFNFESGYTFDLSGFATRTISGYVEIPLSRWNGNRRVLDNVDRLRERITPSIPFQFERVVRDFRISLDKRRMDFNFVDRELPTNSLPSGCIDASGSHAVRSVGGTLGAQWQSNLAASYTLAKDRTRSEAWAAFYSLLTDRLGQARQANASPILLTFGAVEGLYRQQQELQFEASYTFITSIENVFKVSGLYRPLPGTNYQQWATSVAVARSPRGFSNLHDLPESDAIIDLCGSQVSSLVADQGVQQRDLRSGVAPQVQSRALTAGGGIRPATSWNRYINELTVGAVNGAVRLKVLPLESPAKGENAMGEVNALVNQPGVVKAVPGEEKKGGVIVAQRVAPTKDIIQQRAEPSYTARLKGEAIRAGFKVPIPKLTEVGGQKAIPQQQRSSHRVLGVFNGVPVYHATWDLAYLLEGPPSGTVPAPANPQLKVGG